MISRASLDPDSEGLKAKQDQEEFKLKQHQVRVAVVAAVVTFLVGAASIINSWILFGEQKAQQAQRDNDQRRASLNEKLDFTLERYDKARGDLSTILAEAMRNRGAALILTRVMEFAGRDDGMDVFDQGYVWMGHRLENGIQVKRALDQIDLIKNMKTSVAHLQRDISNLEQHSKGGNITAFNSPSLQGITHADMYTLAAMMIQNGHYRSGLRQLAEMKTTPSTLQADLKGSSEMEFKVLQATAEYLSGNRAEAQSIFDALVSSQFAWTNLRDATMYQTIVAAVWCELEVSELIQNNRSMQRQIKLLEQSKGKVDATKLAVASPLFSNSTLIPLGILRNNRELIRKLPDSVFTNIYGVNKSVIAAMEARVELAVAHHFQLQATLTESCDLRMANAEKAFECVKLALEIVQEDLNENNGLELNVAKLLGDLHCMAKKHNWMVAEKIATLLSPLVQKHLDASPFDSRSRAIWISIGHSLTAPSDCKE